MASPDQEAPLQGTVAPGFEPVRDAFAAVVDASDGTGAAVAAWHDGRWVVDLWGGFADAARSRPWGRDSLVMPYSVTKPFAAACVLILADRGLVDLDAPIASVWPAFTAPATIRQVLAHQAGVVVIDEPLPGDALLDVERMERALERQAALWTPGSAHGEAALVYGHLLGGIVRRVDGRSLGTFLREEIAGPFGLDVHVGLREEELARTVELTGFDATLDRELADYGELFARSSGNPPGALDPAVVNSEPWRRAEIAAVNGHATARAVSGFYVALVHEGLLGERLLGEARRVHAAGHDEVLGQDAAWGLGFAVDADGFGMGGIGGSYGWWSDAGGYAFAFLTGHLGDPDRGDRVEAVLREVLGLPGA